MALERKGLMHEEGVKKDTKDGVVVDVIALDDNTTMDHEDPALIQVTVEPLSKSSFIIHGAMMHIHTGETHFDRMPRMYFFLEIIEIIQIVEIEEILCRSLYFHDALLYLRTE